jgi:hypothetical protein
VNTISSAQRELAIQFLKNSATPASTKTTEQVLTTKQLVTLLCNLYTNIKFINAKDIINLERLFAIQSSEFRFVFLAIDLELFVISRNGYFIAFDSSEREIQSLTTLLRSRFAGAGCTLSAEDANVLASLCNFKELAPLQRIDVTSWMHFQFSGRFWKSPLHRFILIELLVREYPLAKLKEKINKLTRDMLLRRNLLSTRIEATLRQPAKVPKAKRTRTSETMPQREQREEYEDVPDELVNELEEYLRQ